MLHSEPLSQAALDFEGIKHQELEGTVLSTIINAKIKSLALKRQSKLPVRSCAHVSLYEALAKSGRHFILECKKASPSLGDFAHDFNLDRLIDCYNARASAISVLCEEHFFKGSLDYLSYVKARTPLPVICKDFILCTQQLDEACAAGADAVLLMLSVLEEEKFKELYAYARALGLDVLCEVATEAEAEFAKASGIRICGINNRDLKTLQIDLSRAPSLSRLFSSPTVVVSESGLSRHSELRKLEPIHNYLVGSSLTGAASLYFAANSLLYGVNKVCGLTTPEAVLACVRSKVALGGLIFVRNSPRYVSLKTAQHLIKCAEGRLLFVGVFADADQDELIRTVTECQLSMVQLHGSESPAYIEALKARLPDLQIIKALNPDKTALMAELERYKELCTYLLLDSSRPGSGLSLDFAAIPDSLPRDRTLLAGGIGLDNLQEALSLGFAGLDLNSKLELERGRKEPQLIEQAFELINNF
ncbi:MAG: bifunctional indole-3-glycerol-phosphate synthase TrpC/phosphoribosylanthranilate isomerase TrpF [Succinivibrio sp.]|nr:bifunctional indole-3-glycerol-phosphate synthase TrpC/phosphoribosylanthranilate isomerase TrpF [Succinivibrio sp.]